MLKWIYGEVQVLKMFAITEPLVPRRSIGEAAQEVVLSNGGISLEDIAAKLMFWPRDNGQVRLVWDLVIALKNGENWWNIRVDAVTGDILSQNDYEVGK